MALNNFKNILYNTYRFHTRIRNSEESIQEFIKELTKLAMSCDFENPERRVRDQIILGINDDNFRGALFTLIDPNLRELLDFINKSLRITNSSINESADFNNSSAIVHECQLPVAELHNEEADCVMIIPKIKEEEKDANENPKEKDANENPKEKDANENPKEKYEQGKCKGNQEVKGNIDLQPIEIREIKIENCSIENEIKEEVQATIRVIDLESSSDSDFEPTKTDEKCKKCEKIFKSRRSVINHMRIHTGRCYKCNKCNQTYWSEIQLRKHLETCQKKKKCPHCKKNFMSQTCLQSHIRMHKGKGTYDCTKCDKKFLYPCRLRDHLSSHNDYNP